MKETGRMIKRMDLEKKLYRIILNMKDSIKMVKDMEKESIYLKMEKYLLEIFKKI